MEVWIPIIIFIGVPLAIVAAVVYALVRIRKRREKDNAQVSRAGDGVDPKIKKLFKAASKRYFGLSNWAWTAAIIAVYEVWTEISAVKSGDGSFGTMQFTLLLAAVVSVLIFRDWLKPRRLSRVWRVLSITGVALVCSVGVLWFIGTARFEWGSCVSGDCESGYGTFNYLSCDIYEGEFRNGQRVRGTRRYANGLTYAGEWVEGAHGQGTSTWPNGDVYVGEHLGLRPWGTGTKTYADGRVESGQWVFGTLEEPE